MRDFQVMNDDRDRVPIVAIGGLRNEQRTTTTMISGASAGAGNLFEEVLMIRRSNDAQLKSTVAD